MSDELFSLSCGPTKHWKIRGPLYTTHDKLKFVGHYYSNGGNPMTIRLTVLLLVLISIGITLSTVLVASASLDPTQDKSSSPEKTAEQVYKNIQVFKGVPASQL